jgi:hypothetical protein
MGENMNVKNDHGVFIEQISQILPHPNTDRLEIAMMEGNCGM